MFPNAVVPSSIHKAKRPEYLISKQHPDKLGLIRGLTPNNQAINNTQIKELSTQINNQVVSNNLIKELARRKQHLH